jgi:hypothetical protein
MCSPLGGVRGPGRGRRRCCVCVRPSRLAAAGLSLEMASTRRETSSVAHAGSWDGFLISAAHHGDRHPTAGRPPSPTPAASTRRPMIPLRRDQTDQTERTAAARDGFPPAPRTAPNGTPGSDRKPAPADRHCDLNRGGIRAVTHSHAEKRALDHRVKGTRSQLMRTLTRRLARSLKCEGKPLKSYSESSPSRTVEAPIGRFEVVQQLCLFR